MLDRYKLQYFDEPAGALCSYFYSRLHLYISDPGVNGMFRGPLSPRKDEKRISAFSLSFFEFGLWPDLIGNDFFVVAIKMELFCYNLFFIR